jgi:hypothetical protein
MKVTRWSGLIPTPVLFAAITRISNQRIKSPGFVDRCFCLNQRNTAFAACGYSTRWRLPPLHRDIYTEASILGTSRWLRFLQRRSALPGLATPQSCYSATKRKQANRWTNSLKEPLIW